MKGIDAIGTHRRLTSTLGAPAGASMSADIAALQAEVDKLGGAESNGTHAHADNVAWQNVVTLTTTARKKVWAVWMDFNTLTKDMNMRMQYKIDGATARTFWADTWAVTEEDGILINVPRGIANELTVDIQSPVAEGAARDIPYDLLYEDKE